MTKGVREFYLSLIAIIFISVGVLGILDFFTVEDLVEVNTIRVFDTTIVVGRDCLAIIAETTPANAESIELGLKDMIEERPTTHDTFASVLKTYNITLEGVEITRVDDKYFYSNMILIQGDRVYRIDTRPSDAIAIALRTESPIYINKTLLDEIGQEVC